MKLRVLCFALFGLLLLTSATAVMGSTQSRHATAAQKAAPSPLSRRQVFKQLRALPAHAAKRNSPAARAARLRSRLRFRNASDALALEVARDHFGELLRSPVMHGLRLRRGERLIGYTSDRSGLVETADGKHSVVTSSLPLRVRDSKGRRVTLDLRPRRKGDRYEPKAPLVATSIGASAPAGFEFPTAQLSVRPVGARAAEARRVNGKLFYANVANDTDELLIALPRGVETQTVLRSPSSPTDLSYRITGPTGTHLRLVPGPNGFPDSAQVMDGDKSVMAIPAVRATDATGDPVKASYRLHGDVLTVHVEHRGAAVQYPIIVDPTYVFENKNGCTDGLDPNTCNHWSDLSGWSYYSTNSNYHGGTGAFSYQSSVRSGLIISATPGLFRNSDYARWVYAAPHDSYIYRADWQYLTYEFNYTPHCVYAGIFAPSNNAYEPSPELSYCDSVNLGNRNLNNHYVNVCTYGCLQTVGTDNNWMVLGLRATSATAGYTNYISQSGVTMAGAVVYERDRHNPWITGVNQNAGSGWWDVNTGLYAIPTATDDGLGIAQMVFSRPGIPAWGQGLACNGTRASPCPEYSNPDPTKQTYSPRFDYQVNSTTPEGSATYSMTPYDIVTNAGPAATWTVNVDHSAPIVTTSGQLKNAAGNRIEDGAYDLHVGATDGVADGNPANARSGVKSIEIQVDGQRQGTTPTQTCAQNCPMSRDWTFNSERYAAGDHTVSVDVKDQLNHLTHQQWTVKVSHAASASLGPGAVNLRTGSFSTTASDASVSTMGEGLGIQRTFNSRDVAAASSAPFGPGWTASLPVDGPTADFTALAPQPDNSVQITTSDGSNLSFTPGATSGTFDSPDGFDDLTLSSASGTYKLTDLAGNVTTFTNPGPGYVPTSVQESGANTTSTFSYDGLGRLTRAIAPAPAGVSCTTAPTTTRGCRSLNLTYASATSATATTFGDYTGRVSHIDLTAWDPSSSSMTTTGVAQYEYDTAGRLRSAWDPRISPELKEKYSYNADAQLVTLQPAGQEIWNINYATPAVHSSSDLNYGRVLSVSREALPGTATTTVAYNVPVSGTGAPYALGGTTPATWHQQDVATDGTAIFPPDQVPASPPTTYSRATIHYLDAQGREVNTASPGGRIATQEYDGSDNVIRALTPANRAQALASSDSVGQSQQLDTQTTYNSPGDTPDGVPAGTVPTSVVGPLHAVQLSTGEQVSARQHVQTTYDQGAPAGGPYALPTRTTEGAQISGRADADVRTTVLAYSGQSNLGWQLRAPTSTTVDPGGLNLTSTTLYDAATGQPTETRQPANPAGGDARSQQTIFYALTSSDSACAGHAEWAALPCKTLPAAQPGTAGLPNLRVTQYQYNRLNEVTSAVETAGSSTRTTSISYDGAGRKVTTSVSSSDGVAVPSVTTGYDEANGMATTTSSTDGTIFRQFDTLGRITAYSASDGNTGITSFDIDGRPTRSGDDQGSEYYTYDSVTGSLARIDDTSGAAFTGTYNADGNLLTQTLPNGLEQRNTYDSTGDLVHRAYVKTSNCTANCTWLDFGGARSIHGQWLALTGTTGLQSYAYDAAGRLKQAQDTPSGRGCSVRDYGYDADSNRTSQTVHAPAADNSCAPGTVGTTVAHTYDSADRLTDGGTTYDGLGRITSLSAGNSGGGAMTSTYYADDLVRSLNQDGFTTIYQRDPMGRAATLQRVTNSTGATSNTYLHYMDDSDSPSYETSTFGAVTRYISGLDGDLIGQITNAGTALQLENLHGDVVATASLSATATGPSSTLRQADEFGAFTGGSPSSPYSWLGSKRRRTSVGSGIVDMGVREYVPAIGRFLQTDPIAGGSANAYDYANQDPVNGLDLGGMSAGGCNVQGHATGRGTQEGLATVVSIKIHGSVHCHHRIRNVHVSVRFESGSNVGGVPLRATHYAGGNECHHLTHSCESDPTTQSVELSPPLSCGESLPITIFVEVRVTYTYRGHKHTIHHHAQIGGSVALECHEG